jgi:hypothetical protein
MFCWPCVCGHLETDSRCPICSKPLDKSTLVPIYGQAKEAATESPPPPKAQREAPPEQEPRRQGFYPGAVHFQLGLLGAGFHFGLGNGPLQFHRPQRQQIPIVIFVVIFLALTLFQYEVW